MSGELYNEEFDVAEVRPETIFTRIAREEREELRGQQFLFWNNPPRHSHNSFVRPSHNAVTGLLLPFQTSRTTTGYLLWQPWPTFLISTKWLSI